MFDVKATLLGLILLAAPEQLRALVNDALAAWGHTPAIAMTVEDSPAPAGTEIAHAVTWSTPEGVPVRSLCTIVVRPVFWTLPEIQQQRVILHETGHCLGLGHHEGRGVLGPSWDDIEISDEERAMYRAIWPMKNRVVLPGVSFE